MKQYTITVQKLLDGYWVSCRMREDNYLGYWTYPMLFDSLDSLLLWIQRTLKTGEFAVSREQQRQGFPGTSKDPIYDICIETAENGYYVKCRTDVERSYVTSDMGLGELLHYVRATLELPRCNICCATGNTTDRELKLSHSFGKMNRIVTVCDRCKARIEGNLVEIHCSYEHEATNIRKNLTYLTGLPWSWRCIDTSCPTGFEVSIGSMLPRGEIQVVPTSQGTKYQYIDERGPINGKG